MPQGALITWADWQQQRGDASPSGLLFDLDGTLVDTLPLHYEAYRRVFEGHGLTLSWDGFVRHAPSPAAVSIPNFVWAAGGDPGALPSTPILHRAKKAAFAEMMLDTRPARLPASDLFEGALAAGTPVGIVTSGNRHGVTVILRQCGWFDPLEVLITGDDVERGKPHPEPYLRGAEALGIDPTACVAFEDTATGITSARDAGMLVVDVSATRAGG